MQHIVYCYIDLQDDIVKYVGITSRKLSARVQEHKINESWVNTTQWKILYFTVATKSESEAWESHLIALYETYKYFNTAKKDWGLIDLFRNTVPVWKIYSIADLIVDVDYKNYQVLDDFGDSHLITTTDLMLALDVQFEDILCLIAKRIIQPLARTSDNILLFWEDSTEKAQAFYKTCLVG